MPPHPSSGADKPRLRVALLADTPAEFGGPFNQGFSTIETLVRKPPAHDFVVFVAHEETRELLRREHGIESVRYRNSLVFRLLDRWSSTLVGGGIIRRLRRFGLPRLGRHLDALLDDHDIDIAVFVDYSEAVFRVGDHPFVMTVWDMDHRAHPDFPEFFRGRVFERNDMWFRRNLPRAAGVIINWPSQAPRLAGLFHVDRERMIEMPLLPSAAVRRHAAGAGTATVAEMRRLYSLPERYVFYPAYLSPHKNHLYILEALVELERRHGIRLGAVFCGATDPPDQAILERQIEALGLGERVRYLGFIPGEHTPALYEGAVVMAMPSYFGPTNLPPLEAAVLGCPVICSDFQGCREQMGDAALYCDLRDPASLADRLAALEREPGLRARLLAAGKVLAEEIGKVDYGERLGRFLDEFAYVRKRWAWPHDRR